MSYAMDTIRTRVVSANAPAFGELVTHMGVACLDQALLSATNFSIALVLIRGAADAEYAHYVLAFSAMLLAVGMQNALITTQMSVLAPRYGQRQRLQFVSALAGAQYLLWIPLVLVAGLIAVCGDGFGLSPAHQRIMLATAVVVLAVFLREFIRQALFLYRMPWSLLAVDGLYAGLLLTAVTFATTTNHPALYAVTATGAAALTAGMLGLALFRRKAGWAAQPCRSVLATTWIHGRWALLGVIVSWLHAQGFVYLVWVMRGEQDVANVSASRLLIMPVAVMMTGVDSVFKPCGASWLTGGEEQRLFTVTRLQIAGFFLLGLVYVSSLLLGRDLISGHVLRKTIPGMTSLLLLWGAVCLLQIVRTRLGTLLQILRQFDALFYLGTAAAVVSLCLGYVAISAYGAPGAVAALIAGELTCLTGMALVFSQRKRSFDLRAGVWAGIQSDLPEKSS